MFTILAQGKSGGPDSGFIIMLVAMGLFFWFLIIRPQSRQRRQFQQMLASLETGDQVVTRGGVHGRITNVKENTVIVKIADNVKVEISRSHVEQLIKKESAEQKTNQPVAN